MSPLVRCVWQNPGLHITRPLVFGSLSSFKRPLIPRVVKAHLKRPRLRFQSLEHYDSNLPHTVRKRDGRDERGDSSNIYVFILAKGPSSNMVLHLIEKRNLSLPLDALVNIRRYLAFNQPTYFIFDQSSIIASRVAFNPVRLWPPKLPCWFILIILVLTGVFWSRARTCQQQFVSDMAGHLKNKTV